jgi:hypothetical protein
MPINNSGLIIKQDFGAYVHTNNACLGHDKIKYTLNAR